MKTSNQENTKIDKKKYINKDFLSLILGKNIYEVRGINDSFKPQEFEYVENKNGTYLIDKINVYELANQCKIWTFKEKKYIIESHLFLNKDNEIPSFAEVRDWKNGNNLIIKEMPYSNGAIEEWESIVKACMNII